MKNLINILNKNILLILIVLIAFILRLYNLDFQSAWFDELFTLNISNPNQPLSTLIKEVNERDNFPYIYFILIRFLTSIFGYSVYVARFFSVVFGVLSVYMIYKLAKELINKEVGLYAAFILAFNEFSLYLSQEARPYTYYLFSVLLAYYGFVKFVKNVNLRNSIFYGIFAGVLLNSNFFGVINIFTQIITILIIFIFVNNKERINLLKYSLLSGIIAFIMFIPNYKILLKLTSFESGWIPAPTNNTISTLLLEILGNFELTGFIFLIMFVFLLNSLFKKDIKSSFLDFIRDNNYFAFFILSIWIIGFLIVVILKSYLDTSVMVSRYFISILPVLIISFAIGLNFINEKIIRLFSISTLIILTTINLFVIKGFYTSPIKTQFREVAEFVKSNNIKNERIFTNTKYWFDFYLNNNKVKSDLVYKNSFDELINQMKQDSTMINSFYYIDAHQRPFNISDENKTFIDKYFFEDFSYDGLDAWGKHFELISNAEKKIEDPTYFPNLKNTNGTSFLYNIDSYESNENEIVIKGWACFSDLDSKNTSINIVIVKDNFVTKILTRNTIRKDVTQYFNSKFNLSNSGFITHIKYSKLEEGTYKIGISLDNKIEKKNGLILTEKTLVK